VSWTRVGQALVSSELPVKARVKFKWMQELTESRLRPIVQTSPRGIAASKGCVIVCKMNFTGANHDPFAARFLTIMIGCLCQVELE
jgi:hypothetical protein